MNSSDRLICKARPPSSSLLRKYIPTYLGRISTVSWLHQYGYLVLVWQISGLCPWCKSRRESWRNKIGRLLADVYYGVFRSHTHLSIHQAFGREDKCSMSEGHAGFRLHIWSILWGFFLTTFIQSFQALLLVAISVHQPPFLLILSYSGVYIYNWRQTPRKVPLVSPLVKPADTPPGFMPCCAGSDWIVQQKSWRGVDV